MADIHSAIYKLAMPHKVARIKGHEGYYATSNGRIITTKNNRWGIQPENPRFRALVLEGNGYYSVSWPDGTSSWVHRIILESFSDHIPELDVLHGGNGTLDNSLVNLRWGTHQENMMDKVQSGTSNRGERSATHKLTEKQVNDIRNELKNPYWGISRDLAEIYGVDASIISHIKAGRIWGWLL